MLVPLYGHCYLPAAPAAAGGPVFSVQPGEVRVYATDLLHYVDVEFGSAAGPTGASATRLELWSDLAEPRP